MNHNGLTTQNFLDTHRSGLTNHRTPFGSRDTELSNQGSQNFLDTQRSGVKRKSEVNFVDTIVTYKSNGNVSTGIDQHI